MATGELIALDGMYLNIGGAEITGFAEDAIDIPAPESLVATKKGLDRVSWLKKNDLSKEIEVTVNLIADSDSVKVLKVFEKTNAIVAFHFQWEDLGIYVEAAAARVEEVGSLKVNGEMPDISFKVTLKDIAEMKGI